MEERENLGTNEGDTNEDAGCPSSSEGEDELMAEARTGEETDGGGDAASSPILIQGNQQLGLGPNDTGSHSPLPQEDSPSASAGRSGSDNREIARLRQLLGTGGVKTSVLTRMEMERGMTAALRSRIAEAKLMVEAMERELRERRAEREVLMNMLAGTRAELRRLRMERIVPQREHLNQSGSHLIMDCANDMVAGAATGLENGGTSEPGTRDRAAACSPGQVSEEDDMASGGSQDKNGPDSDHVEETEEEDDKE